VYMDWGGGFHRFHQRHFGERRVPALRTNIRELVRDHLGNRGGACYLPWGQRSQLREQGLTPVRGAPEFKRRLNMVYHRGGAQRELVETAVDVFRDVTL
jgi:hypothetical protein